LLDDIDRRPFIGCDTSADVTIIDTDDSGFIGFLKSEKRASPLDDMIKVKLRRFAGATGIVTAKMTSKYLDPVAKGEVDNR
jgi:hypothetical protein